MEKDYAKIDKLLSLRREYSSRLKPVEASIEQERKEADEEQQEIMASEWLSRRLDAGLFSLQVFYMDS
jgi:beta-catenin-like protein 1